MSFSLKQYINKKYLTEKLLSDILLNTLLNESGGMFKYYKIETIDKKNEYDKLCKLNKDISYIFKKVELSCIQNYDYETLYKKYIDLFEKYKMKLSHIFDKPDIYIFKGLITYTNCFNIYNTEKIDFYNITDEHFEKYTYKEILNNKELKDKITNLLSRPIFWLNANNKILLYSKNFLPVLYSVISEEGTENISIKLDRQFLTKEDIQNCVSYDTLTENTEYKITNINNKVLKWPYLRKTDNKGQLIGYYFIEEYLNLENFPDNKNIKPIGKFMSKKSLLYRTTHWGDNENDYILIYKPESIYDDKNFRSTYNDNENISDKKYIPNNNEIFGYNDYKIRPLYNYKKRERNEAYNSRQTYTWLKDEFGKYLKYGGNLKKAFKFGDKLETYDYETLYGNDSYCNKLVYANILRYKLIILKNKSLLCFKKYKVRLDEIVQIIKKFIQLGKEYNNKIKIIYKTNIDKANNLIKLYGNYMYIINDILKKYTAALESIDEFTLKYKNYITKNKASNELTYDSNNIATLKTTIEIEIKNLENIVDTINSLSLKLNEIILN